MSELANVQLKDIADLKGGFAFKSKDYQDSGRFILRTVNIDQNGRITRDGATYISEEKAKEYDRFELEPWDTLFVMVGATLGKVGLVKDGDLPALLNQNMWVVRAFPEKVSPRFLHYAFSQKSKEQLGWASGAARDFVRRDDFRNMEIPIPKREVQDQIASFIGAIDDKIELNRQINRTLEEMAQAIFKSWFVDFEPVKAKILVREKGGSQLAQDFAAQAIIAGNVTLEELEQMEAGYSVWEETLHPLVVKNFEPMGVDLWEPEHLAATAALFPSALQDSPLGPIPEGWVVGKLSDIAAFTTARVGVDELSPETYVSTENMLEGKKGITRASSLPSVKTVPSFTRGHILISNIRPYFKKIWLARFDGGRSNDVLGMESIDANCVEYLYNLLYQDSFFNFMMTTSKGAKMPRGDKGAIMGWLCMLPDPEVTKVYSSFVRNYYKHIDSLNKEGAVLEPLRDALLPKLLSGEISPECIEDNKVLCLLD